MARKPATTTALNIRKVDPDIARQFKAEAARRGLTSAAYLALLVRRARLPSPWGA
ncbi:MAG: hypothetical protein Q8S13_07050 [Dehalococcoidia bacterium]|nr:hypothetical protein [Dehalococcoidia bacterium]